MSKIEDAVAKQLLLRAKIGEKKYGTTMERNDLSLLEWLQHAQEEAMDLAVYLEKIKQEIHYSIEVDPDMVIYGEERFKPRYPESEVGACNAHDRQMQEDEMEKRMDIIGQNGNDGLHYDEANYMYDKLNWANKDAIQKRQQHTNNCGNCTVVYPGDIKITYETTHS